MGSNSSTNNPVRPRDRRIVLLGKTGGGKSSTGNTIFGGEEVFPTASSSNSKTEKCEPESRIFEGRTVTLIDTPGLFDTRISKDELKPEIINCITESARGVHAFLIVLKVERFTVHEREICTQIQQSFSDEAFKYATVLFTHGDDLEGKTIQDFVKENDELHDLVQKCGGRFHVIDNKHWNQDQWYKNSINQVQVSELLKTIDQTVEQNGGNCYTNEMLQAVQEDIQAEKISIREKSGGKLSMEESHRQAKKIVQTKLAVKWTGIATGALMGALFGAVGIGAPIYLTGTAAALTATLTGAAVGGIAGGIAGYIAAERAETAGKAAVAPVIAVFGERAGQAVEAVATAACDKATEYYKQKSL